MTGTDDPPVADAGRPTWLTEDCPSWCVRIHHEDDHPEDRYHQSEPSTFPAIAGAGDSVPLTRSLRPTTLTVRIGRHVGEHRTWLVLEPVDAPEPRIVLTADSAAELRPHLQDQLDHLRA